MEEYLSLHYKQPLDAKTFKTVRSKILTIQKRFKPKYNKLQIGKKSMFNTLHKNIYLLEKFLSKLMVQKIKDHKNIEINTSNYEEVVKKDRTEKKFRKKIFELEEEIKSIRLFREFLNAKFKEKEEEEKLKLKKIEYHEDMQTKARQRQEENEKLKKIRSQRLGKVKPRFMEMEEEYKVSFELTEAQRTRSELAKKSQYMKNINFNELKEHAKHYEKIISEAKKRREVKMAEASLENSINSINMFKRAASEEREVVFNAKKNLIIKRKNYGDIVRELFSPRIEFKPLFRENSEEKKVKAKSVRENSEINVHKKVVYKRKLPEKIIQEDFIRKKKDYLSEMRVNRGTGDGSNEIDKFFSSFCNDKIEGEREEILKKLKGVEKAVNNQEKRIKLTGNGDDILLDYKLSELLIQSVKAKMQMLEKINN